MLNSLFLPIKHHQSHHDKYSRNQNDDKCECLFFSYSISSRLFLFVVCVDSALEEVYKSLNVKVVSSYRNKDFALW